MDPKLRTALASAPGLLFVCSGNMIRSAFAELYARHLGVARPLRSAATTYFNTAIHPRARAALLARGIPASLIDSFRPTHVSELGERLEEGSVALCMTREHLALLERARAIEGPRFLLGELEEPGREISDPLFDGRYEQCFAALARCIETLARALAPEGGGRAR